MQKKSIFLFLSIFPVFFLIYILHQYLLKLFDIKAIDLANNLVAFISFAGFVMLTNLLLVYLIKPKLTGFVFLAWSMLKIMLIIAYFVFFIFPRSIQVPDGVVYDLIFIYTLLLIYEVFFTIILVKKIKIT